MLHRLIGRNEDIRRLANEGYDLSLSRSGNHLLVSHIPYVTPQLSVAYGTLVAELNQAGDLLNAPKDHVVMFIGEMPCDAKGKELDWLRHSNEARDADAGLRVSRSFSARPAQPYTNYYDKLTTYVGMLSAYAVILEPGATAKTFPPIPLEEGESVFRYADTSSSRAGISAISVKLEMAKIAIVGVGGTGSYVLDFVAKTPVKEIHLYDKDVFSSHNAFRSPGAASLEDLEVRPSKVAYLERVYSKMRRGIIVHEQMIDGTNVEELANTDFVFLCMDGGETKRLVAAALLRLGVPFVDVGLGLQLVEGRLTGVARTTTVSREKSDHVANESIFGGGGVNEYDRNIQVADLNALNAALAVIRWKKLCGFYADEVHEHSAHYSISRNQMLNEHCL